MAERLSDEELVAFLDGEVDAARFVAIEAMLERDTALAARAAMLTATAGQLRDAFVDVLREPVPAWLLLAASPRNSTVAAVTSGSLGPRMVAYFRGLFRTPRQWAPLAASAAVCGIVFGSSLGYMAGSPAQGTNVLDSLAGAHNLLLESANAGEPAAFDVPAGADQKLPSDIHIPEMKPFGLSFQGTRKTVVDGGKLAYQFYYTSVGKKQPGPITVTIWKTTKPELAPTFDRRDNLNVMYWRHAGHGYAIVGEADKGYMSNMSQDIAWQLRPS